MEVSSKSKPKQIVYYGGRPEKPIITQTKKQSDLFYLAWSGISDAEYIQIQLKTTGKWVNLSYNGKAFTTKDWSYISIARGAFTAKTNYMRIRSYKKIKGNKKYSSWSKTITIRY